MSASKSEFEKRLRDMLGRHLGDALVVERIDRLSGGASQETYRIDVRLAYGRRTLALRRALGGANDARLEGQVGLRTEAKLMRVAKANGIPEPEVIAELAPGDGLGDGFVMEWLDGETLGKRVNTAVALADARRTLALECGSTLARIHAIDLDASGLRQVLEVKGARQLVEETMAQYIALDIPQPMLDYAAKWLLSNVPAAPRETLVHADFRNGNLMVGPDGLVAVLDWELAHIGDPIRDLGWLCTGSWRFGVPELAVGGFGTRAQLLEGYESVSGERVNPDDLRFWEVFGSFWWGVVCLSMAQHHRSGVERSIERAAIGRRSSECQIDCVNLLIPGPCSVPSSSDADGGLDLPSAGELLEAVGEFLRDDVTDAVSGRTKFLARVAANALGIVVRQTRLAPAVHTAERERLRVLARDGWLGRAASSGARGTHSRWPNPTG